MMYKALQTTTVNIEKMNIFEIFIRMFVDEVFFIVKRGLKCSYETIEEKATFFRGKMKFSQQIRHNYIHKERSYVEYDALTVIVHTAPESGCKEELSGRRHFHLHIVQKVDVLLDQPPDPAVLFLLHPAVKIRLVVIEAFGRVGAGDFNIRDKKYAQPHKT